MCVSSIVLARFVFVLCCVAVEGVLILLKLFVCVFVCDVLRDVVRLRVLCVWCVMSLRVMFDLLYDFVWCVLFERF